MTAPPLLTNPENNKNILRRYASILITKCYKLGKKTLAIRKYLERLCNKFIFRNLEITEYLEKSSQPFLVPSPIFSILDSLYLCSSISNYQEAGSCFRLLYPSISIKELLTSRRFNFLNSQNHLYFFTILLKYNSHTL